MMLLGNCANEPSSITCRHDLVLGLGLFACLLGWLILVWFSLGFGAVRVDSVSFLILIIIHIFSQSQMLSACLMKYLSYNT